ncbi:unnamed protein product [Mortierella alpina]
MNNTSDKDHACTESGVHGDYESAAATKGDCPPQTPNNQEDHSKSFELDLEAHPGGGSMSVDDKDKSQSTVGPESGNVPSPSGAEQVVADLHLSVCEKKLEEERSPAMHANFQRAGAKIGAGNTPSHGVHPARSGQEPDNVGGKPLLRNAWIARRRLMERTVDAAQVRTGYGLDDSAANAAEHLFEMLNRCSGRDENTPQAETPLLRAVMVTAGDERIKVVECYCPDIGQAGMRVSITGLRALCSPSSATGNVVTTRCERDVQSQGVHDAGDVTLEATVSMDSDSVSSCGSVCSVLGFADGVTTVCLQGDACGEIFAAICASIRATDATDAYKRRLLWFMGSLCVLYNTVLNATDLVQDERRTPDEFNGECVIPDGQGWRDGRGRGLKVALTIGPFCKSILLNGWAMGRYASRETGAGISDLATYRDGGQMLEYPKAVDDDVRGSVTILADRLLETENDRWAAWCTLWAYVKSEHDVGLAHLKSTIRTRTYLARNNWLTLNALDTASESVAYDTEPLYRDDAHCCLLWARLFDDLLDVNRDLQTGELFSLARGMTVGVHRKLIKLCIAAFNGYASPRASRLTAGIAWSSAIWYLCNGRHEIWRQWQGVETESSECELCAVGSAEPLAAMWGNSDVAVTACIRDGTKAGGNECIVVVTHALTVLSGLDQAHTGYLTDDEWRAHKHYFTASVDVPSIATQVASALQQFSRLQGASYCFGVDKTFDEMWVTFYTIHLIVRFDMRLRDAAQAYVDTNAVDIYEAMWLDTDEVYARLAVYLCACVHPHWAYRPILNVAANSRGGDY